MNNTKRVLSVLLAALMLASVVAAIAIADGSNYTIVINYVFQDGTQAAAPWTASIGDGQSFTDRIVTIPTIVGYEPYESQKVDGFTPASDMTTVEINIAKVNKGYTYTVTYKPALVEFTVEHKQQNVNDDGYTLVKTEKRQGYTESEVGTGLANEYEGFTALLYDTDTKIAADGSTVVEIKYDRNYYLMKFDLDGGYGVEPIYARYGAVIGDVGTPSKAGYTFKGWSETEGGTTAVSLPTAMPAESKTYYAIWEANDTAKVTIVFWGENADDEGYSYLSDYTQEVYMKPGKEFTYSEGKTLICDMEAHNHTTAGCSLTCGQEEHTHSAVGGSCYTLDCQHVHTVDCYKGVGGVGNERELIEVSKPSQITGDTTADGIYTYETGSIIKTTHYYLKIGDKWYTSKHLVSSGEDDNQEIKLDCQHTHTDSCYKFTCATVAHTHGDGCYDCGKVQHTHNDGCYTQGTSMDSTLWKFVKSDTVIVAADGSSVVNVYYDRTEFTLTFKYGYSNKSYRSSGTITDKWGADISTRFNDMSTAAGNNKWSRSDEGTSPWTTYLQVMPSERRTYYMKSTDGNAQIATYYVEKLDSTDSSNVSNYEEKTSISTNSDGTLGITDEDAFDIDGFTFTFGYEGSNSSRKFTKDSDGVLWINGSKLEDYNTDKRKYSGSKFYYSRNSYTLTFNNLYSDVKKESVKYEAPLSTYNDYKPEVPAAYEAGSVLFAGWYQNPQCTGEEYKLDEHTMPANDVILYAKWVPVVHTVTTRLTADAEEKIGTIENVPHGSTVDKDNKAIATPQNGNYEFVGWFYVDEDGTEKAFDPENMTVNRDLNLYAKWRSDVLVEYTISYKLEDGIKVADDTTGTALGGTTKTFDAKVGDELNEDYQEGFFPNVSSHSITMSLEADAKNEFVFIYTKAQAMPYTVRYLEKDTEAVLHEDKVVSDNKKSVVDEYYENVQGYVPDEPQKRLTITADEKANVLTFWYTKDDKHAPVTIIHWTQNIEGNEYTKHSSSSYTGDISATITADVLTIEGFAYAKSDATYGDGKTQTDVTENGEKTKVSATLTVNGLIINLYYDRIEYPYEFRFVSALDGKEIAASVTGTARFGASVNCTASEKIDNKYKFTSPVTVNNTVINQTQSQQMTIKASDTENVITFYYYPYFTVKHVQDGTLNTNATEEVLITQNNFTYSLTDDVPDGYLYGGTFSDEACTTVYPFANGESGLSFTPEVGATYYIWEPNENYLKPKAYSIYRNSDPNAGGKTNIIEVYLASTVDREMYQEVGFTMNSNNYLSNLGDDNATTGTVYSYVKTEYTYTDPHILKEELYASVDGSFSVAVATNNGVSTLPSETGGFVSMVKVEDHTQYTRMAEKAMVYQPYWITLDGVTVTGITVRTCYYKGAGDGNEYKLLDVVDVDGTSTCSYGSSNTQTTVLANATAELRAIADGEEAPAVEETPVVEETPTEPEVYEVPEMTYEGEAQYLRVQYTANTMLNTATLISAVDMNEFSEAGFIINGKKYVCTAFSTMVEGYDANYLFGNTVEGATLMSCNVVLDGFANGETLHITPYWVNNSGVTVYGETRTVVYYSWCGFEG